MYSVDDVGVSPPVVIDQRMPAMTPEMLRIIKALNTNAILDVVIDETGDVVDATIRKSVNVELRQRHRCVPPVAGSTGRR